MLRFILGCSLILLENFCFAETINMNCVNDSEPAYVLEFILNYDESIKPQEGDMGEYYYDRISLESISGKVNNGFRDIITFGYDNITFSPLHKGLSFQILAKETIMSGELAGNSSIKSITVIENKEENQFLPKFSFAIQTFKNEFPDLGGKCFIRERV